MILDEFILQFTSNAKKTQADVSDLDKQIDALAAKGKSRTDTEKQQLRDLVKLRSEHTQDIKDQTKATDGLGNSLLDLGAKALIGFSAFSFLKSGLSNAADLNYQLEKQQRLFGLNASEINAYDQAVVQAGGTQGEFVGWITQYAQQLQAIGQGDKIKNIIPDLRNIADQMQRMSGDDAQALGAKLGIPPDVVLALRNGSAELDKMVQYQRDLGSISENSTKHAKEFGNAWSNAANTIAGAFSNLFSIVAPLFTFLLNAFSGNFDDDWNKWLKRHLPEWATKKYSVNDIGKSSASSSAPSKTEGNPANRAIDFFVSNGYTREQADGLVARMGRESNFNPNAIGDNGAARGLFQWHPDRQRNILAGTGIDVRTAGFDDQLKASLWELQNTESAANAQIKRAVTAEQAGYAVSSRYIRPGKPGEDVATAADAAAYARSGIGAADASPLNVAPGNTSISNQRSLSIGSLTVQTQATDAAGIAAAVHTELAQQFQTVINNYDDGVAR